MGCLLWLDQFQWFHSPFIYFHHFYVDLVLCFTGYYWFGISYPCFSLVSWVIFFYVSSVRPCQDCKYPFLVATICVYVRGPNAAAWMYLIRPCMLDIWPTLFACIMGSKLRFCLMDILLWSCGRHSPVLWSPHPCRMIIPFIFMLKVFL